MFLSLTLHKRKSFSFLAFVAFCYSFSRPFKQATGTEHIPLFYCFISFKAVTASAAYVIYSLTCNPCLKFAVMVIFQLTTRRIVRVQQQLQNTPSLNQLHSSEVADGRSLSTDRSETPWIKSQFRSRVQTVDQFVSRGERALLKAHAHARTHPPTHPHTHTHIHTLTHAHTLTQTNTRTHTHTLTHTHVLNISSIQTRKFMLMNIVK